jgi:bacillithiol biosynthesis cysteine-adding enzyme BshC
VKQEFLPLAERELQQQFSSQAVNETIEKFPAEFKVQTAGREINLFYLTNDARERIEREENTYRIGKEIFSREQLLESFTKNPETISPNVVLRPVFQEMILPNVAFIGGGGELAYWLELKQVFEAAEVPFPVLILRNSFLILNQRAAEIMKDLALQKADLFKPEYVLANEYILKQEGENIKLDEYRQRLKELYNMVAERAAGTDTTLKQHTDSLFTTADKRMELLEKKMMRAVRKKDAVSMNKIAKLKSMVYPGGNLQERVDNFLTYYSLYGPQWFDAIMSNSPAFSEQFIILKQKG